MKLNFLYPVEENLWADWVDFVNHWFPNKYADGLEELVIIVPQAEAEGTILDRSSHPMWNEIYRAWCQIITSSPGTQLKAWQIILKYGEEIAPNLRVFRLRGSSSPCFFWLSSNPDIVVTLSRLADLIPKISAYCHIQHGRGLFHAAGILHKGQAYLFMGASGAGKSTISILSSIQGDKVIHDDHLVVYRGETGKWLVSDTSHSLHGIPVKAISFLVQDHKDQLITIKSSESVKRLLESLHEHGSFVLFGDVIRSAFTTCAEIVRHVPGYELHFRKSPDFWKLIDEQFPA